MKGTRGRKKPSDDPNAPLSIHAIHKRTGADRALLKRILEGVKPAGWEGENQLYTLKQVEVALATKRATAGASLRDQKLEQEIRKLTLANDRLSGVLVERSAVAESMARCCARWNQERLKLEQTAPVQLRAEAKALTLAIGEALQRLAEEFKS